MKWAKWAYTREGGGYAPSCSLWWSVVAYGEPWWQTVWMPLLTTLLPPTDGSERPQSGDIWRDDLDAFIVPAGACGGAAVLSLLGSRTLIVAVEENESAMDVQPESVGGHGRIVRVRSYMEAIGLVAAHRTGINPACLTPTIVPMRDLEAPRIDVG